MFTSGKRFGRRVAMLRPAVDGQTSPWRHRGKLVDWIEKGPKFQFSPGAVRHPRVPIKWLHGVGLAGGFHGRRHIMTDKSNDGADWSLLELLIAPFALIFILLFYPVKWVVLIVVGIGALIALFLIPCAIILALGEAETMFPTYSGIFIAGKWVTALGFLWWIRRHVKGARDDAADDAPPAGSGNRPTPRGERYIKWHVFYEYFWED